MIEVMGEERYKDYIEKGNVSRKERMMGDKNPFIKKLIQKKLGK